MNYKNELKKILYIHIKDAIEDGEIEFCDLLDIVKDIYENEILPAW